ncbi:hypothetical protein [Pseudonocardia sp. TMWB2A]|uniref:hypothetical protein n=1 Tax=Pseudonocardia sp. TMWB2A TaxID=687430 RepID=UPI00307CF31F
MARFVADELQHEEPQFLSVKPLAPPPAAAPASTAAAAKGAIISERAARTKRTIGTERSIGAERATPEMPAPEMAAAKSGSEMPSKAPTMTARSPPLVQRRSHSGTGGTKSRTAFAAFMPVVPIARITMPTPPGAMAFAR